jgi:hypothetical protein
VIYGRTNRDAGRVSPPSRPCVRRWGAASPDLATALEGRPPDRKDRPSLGIEFGRALGACPQTLATTFEVGPLTPGPDHDLRGPSMNRLPPGPAELPRSRPAVDFHRLQDRGLDLPREGGTVHTQERDRTYVRPRGENDPRPAQATKLAGPMVFTSAGSLVAVDRPRRTSPLPPGRQRAPQLRATDRTNEARNGRPRSTGDRSGRPRDARDRSGRPRSTGDPSGGRRDGRCRDGRCRDVTHRRDPKPHVRHPRGRATP